MFIIKNNYYLYIENTKSLNLNLIQYRAKICIIYRNNNTHESVQDLIKFRKKCHTKNYKLYIANNYRLAKYCKADGLYLSSYNKKNYYNIEVIGAAHNYKEINQKIRQGCKTIILSRLFNTAYKYKRGFYGIVKFNLLINNFLVDFVPLGGINGLNLLKLNLVNTKSFALFSELKKKPAIANRLF